MPPFGRRWFRVLEEPNHPLAILRTEWVLLNIQEDWKIDSEIRKNEIEYGGFFANPDVYKQVKHQKGEDTTFKIVYDNSDFDRRLGLAATGQVEIHDRREDLAALVKIRREERERAMYGNDTRIIDPGMGLPPELNDDDDSLIIEHRKK